MPTHDGPPQVEYVRPKKKEANYDTNGINLKVCDQR